MNGGRGKSSAQVAHRKRSRRLVVLRATCLAIAVLLAGCGSSPTAPGVDTPTTPGGPAAAPLSGLVNNFVWVGVSSARQFNDSELRNLADNYDFVVIAAFHCDGVRSCHNDAARLLKERNPSMTVLAYINAKLRGFEGKNELELFGKETFNPDWFLRDQNTGELITVGSGRGGVLDISLPEVRQWEIAQIQEWMAAAPFDGVAFDRVQGLQEGTQVWIEQLSDEKIAALDAADVDLIRETRAALASDKLVVFNGMKDFRSTLEGRIYTAPLPHADGIANEYFCYHKDFGFLESPGFSLEESLILEVEAQLDAAEQGNAVLAHVSYQDDTLSQEEKNAINRLCYGSFLLGHRPGYTSYKFGFLTTQRVLDESAAEKNVALGEPSGAYVALGGGVYSREFANGIVVVNMGPTETTFRAPFASVLMNGGVAGRTFSANETTTIPGRDALFLTRQ